MKQERHSPPGHLTLVRRNDERPFTERDGDAPVTLRAVDPWRMPNPPCDGCGSASGLQWACGSDDYDQYRCADCGCRVFVAR